LELDFTASGWCEKYFRFPLGTDGQTCSGPDGLTINSKEFTVTPNPNDPSKGLLDNFKFNAYYHAPIYTKKYHELILNTNVAAKQYYKTTAPYPDVFTKRLRNIYADPRLAHAQISMIDPDNGIIAGWVITDMALFALYGRLPLNQYQDFCCWSEPGVKECKPCEIVCDNKYNCYNFMEDCRFINFKQHSTFDDYCRFVNFMKWADYCDGATIALNAWDSYLLWLPKNSLGDGLYESAWATWKSWNDWTEYQYFLRWYGWEGMEKVWSTAGCGSNTACSSISPCSCAGKALAKLEYKCHHVYSGCENCYNLTAPPKITELYPYQFGTKRCCCDYNPAIFLNLVELEVSGACDPLCDFWNLGVGLNACQSSITWYINKRNVFTHVGIGRRLPEKYRVRDNGGYDEDVYVRRVLIDFGTGSLLDAALPNNYDRYRAKNDNMDMTALVPLQDDLSNANSKTNYYQLYHNQLGGLLPVNRADTFATLSNDPSYRIFGQGDIMKIRDIVVINRRVFNDYRIPKSICRPSCGTCNDKPGYCGDDGDCEDLDDWCNEPFDVRDLQIESVPGYTNNNAYSNILPINTLSYPLGNIGNISTGFAGGSSIPSSYGLRDITGGNNQGSVTQYVVTRKTDAKRYYEQRCPQSTGINPYM
jgi:hypothetical protein